MSLKDVASLYGYAAACADFPAQRITFAYEPQRDARLNDRALRTDWDRYFKARLLGPHLADGRPLVAERVLLRGTFLKRDETITLRERDGVWSVELLLAPGLYHYQFGIVGRTHPQHVVWVDDPRAVSDLCLPDLGTPGFKRSGVVVMPELESAPEDWLSWTRARLSAIGSQRCALKLVTPAGVLEASLAHASGERVALRKLHEAGGLSCFHALVDEGFARSASLALKHRDGSVRHGKITETGAVSESASAHFVAPDFTPDWAKGAVWYTLIPDRFRYSGSDAEKKRSVLARWKSDYFALLEGEQNYYPDVYFRKYHGNLPGLAEKLDYLRELGINALCLTPVFAASSYHRYDTVDFRHIDPELGSDPEGDRALLAAAGETEDPRTWIETTADREFFELMRACHERGLRVAIDGVFSHVGDQFWAFRDVVQRGAKSPYAGWFWLTEEPRAGSVPGHEAFFGMGHLPKLRWSDEGLDPAVERHLFDITRRWMAPRGPGALQYGIDGWRLDVANEVPPAFWTRWRGLVKTINPQALILGEMLGTAYERFLDGTTMDAIINYRVGALAVEFFVNERSGVSPAELSEALTRLKSGLSESAVHAMQNVLDSHDLDRIASRIKNRNRPYGTRNKIQYPEHEYDCSRPSELDFRILRMLVAFQVLCPGAPHLFYGTEAGMWGATDPNCRKPMLWDDLGDYQREVVAHPAHQSHHLSLDQPVFDQSLFADLKELLQLRHRCEELVYGDTAVVVPSNGANALGVVRWIEERALIGVFNNGSQPAVVELKLTDIPVPLAFLEHLEPLVPGRAELDVDGDTLRVFLDRKKFVLLVNYGREG